MKLRLSEEVQAQLADLMAQADAIKAKYADGSEMSEEDATALADLVAQMEALQAEREQADVRERMEAIKVRQAAPLRPAPRLTPVHRQPEAVTAGQALGLWLRAHGPEGDRSPEAAYRLRTAGIDMGSSSVKLPLNYGTLNKKQRTVLTKGGALTGADYVWQSYSDKVVEYLTYFSPLLSLVGSETTGDGNARSYFVVDDTAMESTYLTASGGTESAPTIPDTNLATAVKVINTFDLSSGYQKVSFQELRDSYIDLESKIAKANSNSHARKLEREVLTATGDGVTAVQGVAQAAHALSNVSAWTQDVLLSALMSIPPQYRKTALFCSNDSVRNDINIALRDEIGRSLFERTIEDDVEFDQILGKKYVVSQYVAANQLLVFVPDFYMLRMVEGQQLMAFSERFWPLSAWASVLSFGGAFIGPTGASGAVHKVTKV